MRFVHLAGLWALAAVQPLFAVLADEPAFFVARDNTAGDILIFAFGWTLIPPLLAYGLVSVLGKPAHLTLIGALISILSLPLFAAFAPPLAFALAAIVGAAGATLYAKREEPARTFVSILGIAPVVVLVLLFVFSPGRRPGGRRRQLRRPGRRPGEEPAARRPDRLRRAPDHHADDGRRGDRREALPELRAPGRELHLVPQRHQRRRRDLRGGARAPHGGAPAVRAADRAPVPEEPLRARRSRVRPPRLRAAHERLPAAALRRGGPALPGRAPARPRARPEHRGAAPAAPRRPRGRPARGGPGLRGLRGGRGRARGAAGGRPGDRRHHAPRRQGHVDGPLRRPARALALPGRRHPVPRARPRLPGPRRDDVGGRPVPAGPGRAAPRADDALRRRAAGGDDRPDAAHGPVGRRARDPGRRPRRQHRPRRAAPQRRRGELRPDRRHPVLRQAPGADARARSAMPS